MSAITSFSPPQSHLQSSSEHLSVHTLMGPIDPHQSLPSAVESIDEVQMGLDVQFDEESAGDDRPQSDHLDADPNTIPQDATDNHVSNEESINSQVLPEHVLEALDEALDKSYKQAAASGAANIDPTVSIPGLTQEPAQLDATTDISFSNPIHTAALQSATFEPAPASDTITGDLAFQEESGGLGSYEAEGLEVAPLDEREISALAQNLARELESGMETDQAQSSVPEAQDIEEISPPEAEPLRRMDDETIPVTAHSKDSIIGILDDAPAAVADETVQFTIVEGQLPAENDPVVPVEAVATPAEIYNADAIPAERPKERTPASIMAHLEHIQVFEPDKDTDGPLDDEDEIMQVEPPVQEVVDNAGGDIVMDHPALAVEEPASAVEAELTTPVEVNTVPDEPALSDDDVQAEATPTTEQVTLVVEQTTAEQMTVEQEEQPEPDSNATIEPAPEITSTDIAITTTTTTTTIVPNESASTDISALAPGADESTETEQVQQEQGASADMPVDGDQGIPAAGDSTAADATQNQEPLLTPDETTPKDSGEPLRTQPESEPEVVETNLGTETVGPIDPAITQLENDPATASAESPHPDPSTSQYQIVTDAPPGLFEQPTPEWEGFAALDEDAPGSPEIPDPSSEISEHPDTEVACPTTNPVDTSTGEAPGASSAANDPPKSTTTRGRDQKRRMIMEVVIPVPANKTKTIKQEIPRGRSKSKSKAAPSSSNAPATPEVDSSPGPISRSSSVSSGTETPSHEDKGKSPARSTSRPRPRTRDSRRPFGSRKRTAKKSSKKPTSTVHAARPLKVEVVMATGTKPKPRASLLRRTGSIPSGNNVKFAPTVPVTGKRKAESEPEEEAQAEEEEEDLDADADGETEDGYEDVEDVEDVKVELPKPRAKKPKVSPIKRPRRSLEARKMPTKLPEVITGSRSPAAKRRRLRR